MATFGLAKAIWLIAEASPGVVVPGDVNQFALAKGILVFMGLLLRDLANGIDREH
jgi:hypothetical protein